MQFFRNQVEIVTRLLEAGLAVTAMESTPHSENYLILLLSPTSHRLYAERQQAKLEQWFARGGLGDLPDELKHSWKPQTLMMCKRCNVAAVEKYDLGGIVCPNCSDLLHEETPADRVRLRTSSSDRPRTTQRVRALPR